MARNCPETLLAVKLPLQTKQRQTKHKTLHNASSHHLKRAGATPPQLLAARRSGWRHRPMVVRSYIRQRINLHKYTLRSRWAACKQKYRSPASSDMSQPVGLVAEQLGLRATK